MSVEEHLRPSLRRILLGLVGLAIMGLGSSIGGAQNALAPLEAAQRYMIFFSVTFPFSMLLFQDPRTKRWLSQRSEVNQDRDFKTPLLAAIAIVFAGILYRSDFKEYIPVFLGVLVGGGLPLVYSLSRNQW